MKYEWRKQEQTLYFPKKVAEIVVPEQKFLVIRGQGNPNEPDFQAHI